MFVLIQCVVLFCILWRVVSEGVAGLMNSDNLFTCRIIPGGKVFVASE